MIPARALFYAIVISLLIAILSGLLISLAHLQRLEQFEQNQQEQLVKNVKSGTALLLGSKEAEIPAQYLDLFNDAQDSVLIHKTRWGLFTAAGVIATKHTALGRDSLYRGMLIGEVLDPKNYPALYLSDRAVPLTFMGNTVIKGDAFLPLSGVVRGFGYLSNEFIQGTQQTSMPFLPPLNEASIKGLLRLFEAKGVNEIPSDSLANSFLEPTLVISGQTLSLQGQNLKGNIILRANQEIIVGKNCHLEDVLLYATKITFEQGFEGTIQAYAYQEMNVKSGCKLRYPSVLGIFQTEAYQEKVSLIIEADSKVDGLVFAYPMLAFRQAPYVSIAEKASVKGLVWVKGELELRGSVQGSVSCEIFKLSSPETYYQNYLSNAIIDRSLLPNEFVCPFIFEKPRKQAIAKWLE